MDTESVFDKKMRKAWERYGTEAGELIEKYDKRFRSIINKYGGGLDKDELYSTLVSLSIPLYIENWKPHKQSDIISWICYCIYLRILKYRASNVKVIAFSENLCSQDKFSSIKIIEDELYEHLSSYEVYLLKTIAVDGYSVPQVAKVNKRSATTIRKDFKNTLVKCRKVLSHD